MGKVLGGVTDAIGLTDNKGAAKAAKNAAEMQGQAMAMSKEQIELMKEQLEFQKEQYQDWKDIYGDVQENLGDYYKNLNGDDIVAMGLTAQQREFQEAVKLITREAAQRGISGSGMESSTMSNAYLRNAEVRAGIRASGEAKANEQKMTFLGVGLGQGTAMLGNINSAASNVNQAFGTGIGAASNFSNNYLNRSTQLGLHNMNTTSDMIGSGLGYAFG